MFALNPQHPDREDGADHGQPADGPSRDIGRAIDLRLVDHGVAPLVVQVSLRKSSVCCQLGVGPRQKVHSPVRRNRSRAGK